MAPFPIRNINWSLGRLFYKCAFKINNLRTLASSNTSRIFFSDSPDIPETTDGAEILINGTPVSYEYCDKFVTSCTCKNTSYENTKFLTPAMAFANKVFPQPGGPYNNIPLLIQRILN